MATRNDPRLPTGPIIKDSPRKPIALTKRDREVIQGLIDGKSNKLIGEGLGISEHTVKVYLSRLYLKTGTGNRYGLSTFGRVYGESERLIVERFHELHPDTPKPDLTFDNTKIAAYEVFAIMAQTIELTPDQASEIIDLLFKKLDILTTLV
jgi:DNA-binding CsgD family transcriptional regulator